MRNNNKFLQVRINEEIEDKITILCHHYGITKSELVKFLILTEYNKQKEDNIK